MATKDYKTYSVSNNYTLLKISEENYGVDKVNELLDFKGNDLEKTNKQRIFEAYTEEYKRANNLSEANPDFLIPGTILALPLKGLKLLLRYESEKQKDPQISLLKKAYWSVEVKEWWKNKTDLRIKYGNENNVLVKKFSKIFIKVFIRSEKRFITLTDFLLECNMQVGKFGGGFSFSLQPVVGIKKGEQYEIDYVTYKGNNFLSKTIVSVKNFLTVRHNFYFEKVLNPQDLIFIKFDEPFVSDEDIIKDDNYDMIGLIDRVQTKVSQNNQEFFANISISGRDLSKVLIEDGTHFFPWEYYAKDEGTAYEKYIANYKQIKDKNILTRIFGRLNVIEIEGNRTVGALLDFIIKRLKVLNLDLTNDKGVFKNEVKEKGIWSLIEFDVEKIVANRTLNNSDIQTMSGSIINFIKAILQEPFVEFFSDTIGNKVRFLARTPPMQKKPYEENLTINVSIDYLIDESLTFSDKDVYSWFLFRPKTLFFNNSDLPPMLIPAVFIEKYAKVYGSKKYESSHTYTYYKSIDNDKEEPKIDVRVAAMEDFKFLLESFIPNPFLKEGSLTFQNISGIKRGMNIYIPEMDMLFYVEGYAHSSTIIDRTTTVQVSRGIKKSNLDLIYNLINVEIDKENNKFKEVSFNEQNFEILLKEK